MAIGYYRSLTYLETTRLFSVDSISISSSDDSIFYSLSGLYNYV